MKFLLELVACCGGGSGSGSGAPVVKEEARLLASSVPPPSSAARRRKRGRIGPNGGGSAVDWQPSLTAICEENVLSERAKMEKENQNPDRKVEATAVKSPSPASDRSLKRKTTSAPKPHSYSSGREEARRPAIHAVMPTFSPAPFMF